jgi:hypothetical protein
VYNGGTINEYETILKETGLAYRGICMEGLRKISENMGVSLVKEPQVLSLFPQIPTAAFRIISSIKHCTWMFE